MKIHNAYLCFCTLLLMTATFAMLPPPEPLGYQAETTPPPRTMQSQAGAGLPPVDFDFARFFNRFQNQFGNKSMIVLQEMINERVKESGLQSRVPTVPVSPPSLPCGSASSINGAVLTYSHPQRIHGSTATYSCQTGYTGSEQTIICDSGSWSTPPYNMSCQIVTCPKNPPTVENANVVVSTFSYGSQATYTCRPGFQADNIAQPITCGANGEWSLPVFGCVSSIASFNPMSMLGNTGPGGNSFMQQVLQHGFGTPTGNPMSMMAGMSGSGAGAGAADGLMASMMSGAGAGNPMASIMSAMGGAGQPSSGASMDPNAQLPSHLAHLIPIAGAAGLFGTPGMNQIGTPGGAPGAPPNRMFDPELMAEGPGGMMDIGFMMMMQSMMGGNRQKQQQQQQQQQKQQQQQQQTQQAQPNQPTLNLPNILSLGTAVQKAQTAGSNTASGTPAAGGTDLSTVVAALQQALVGAMTQIRNRSQQGDSTSLGGNSNSTLASGSKPSTAAMSNGSSGGSVFSAGGSGGTPEPSRPSAPISATQGMSNPAFAAVMSAGLG